MSTLLHLQSGSYPHSYIYQPSILDSWVDGLLCLAEALSWANSNGCDRFVELSSQVINSGRGIKALSSTHEHWGVGLHLTLHHGCHVHFTLPNGQEPITQNLQTVCSLHPSAIRLLDYVTFMHTTTAILPQNYYLMSLEKKSLQNKSLANNMAGTTIGCLSISLQDYAKLPALFQLNLVELCSMDAMANNDGGL